MTLKIISSEDVLFEGEAKSVTLPGTKGAFTVLPNHATLVSTLEKGNVEYVGTDEERHKVAISGGIVDVDNNVVSVCIY